MFDVYSVISIVFSFISSTIVVRKQQTNILVNKIKLYVGDVTDQIGHTQASGTNNSFCMDYPADLMEARSKYWSTLKMAPSPGLGI